MITYLLTAYYYVFVLKLHIMIYFLWSSIFKVSRACLGIWSYIIWVIIFYLFTHWHVLWHILSIFSYPYIFYVFCVFFFSWGWSTSPSARVSSKESPEVQWKLQREKRKEVQKEKIIEKEFYLLEIKMKSSHTFIKKKSIWYLY